MKLSQHQIDEINDEIIREHSNRFEYISKDIKNIEVDH